VEQPLGNVATFAVEGRTIERIMVPSDALAKRILRLSTSRGEVGLRLEGTSLRPGDVVFADADLVVVIDVEPDDVIAITPRSTSDAFELGHLLGNRHWPAQVWGSQIVVPYDPVLERTLLERGAAFTRERRVLETAFRHAGAPHGHG
jgi:urease accessory protein